MDSNFTAETGETLRYRPHWGQWQALTSTKRIVVALAGTQSGKTVSGPLWLLREIQRRGPGDYLVVTPTYPMLELKALPEFRRLFEERMQLGRYVGSPSRRFRLNRDGEARLFGSRQSDPTNVFFGYADDPDSLESATAKGAWLDEAGQKRFKLGSWEAIMRRLAVHQGRVYISTTPYDSSGWLKTKLYDPWERSGGSHPEIDVLRFESTANPAFPVEEYERAKRELPPWKFDLFYRAVFGRPAGMIYDVFDRRRHVVTPFVVPPSWTRYLGLDFGGVNTAGIFLARDPASGVYYACREYHAGGRTARQHAAALLPVGETGPAVVVGGAKSEGQWRDEFRACGMAVREPLVSDVEVGINRVYALLATDRLQVFDSLVGLVREFETYRRSLDASGEPVEGIEDKEIYHRLDALRYIGGYVYAAGNAGGIDANSIGRVRAADAPAGVFRG